MEFAPDLVNMVLDPGTGLDARIENMRLHVAESFGLILPEIRLTDDPSLPPGSYVIRIQGVEQARAVLRPDRVLALTQGNSAGLPPGEEVKEPVYGAPARWIDEVAQEGAALSGLTLVTPTEVLATHLLETIKRNFSRLLTMKSLRRVLEEMVNLSDERRAEANRKLLDELIPEKVPMDLLHQVLRLLVAEQVSIRNMPLILESVAEIRPHMPQPEAICEHVRHRLGFQIISELRREDGTTPLIQLAPGWEETFAAYQLDRDRGSVDIALPPEIFNRLVTNVAEAVSEASDKGIHAGIVTSTQRRRFLRMALSARGIVNPVLSFEEIGIDANPSLVAMVSDE